MRGAVHGVRSWVSRGGSAGFARQRWASLGLIIAAACLVTIWRDRGPLRVAIPDGLEAIGFEKVVEDYARSYGGTIEVVELPYGELYKDVLGAVRSGEPSFDLVLIDDPWLPALLFPRGCEGENPPAPGLAELELSAHDLEYLVEPLVGLGRSIGRRDFPRVAGEASPCLAAGTAHDSSYFALPFVGNSQLYRHGFSNGAPDAHADYPWQEIIERAAALAGRPEDATEIDYALRLGRGNSIVTDFLSILWHFQGGAPEPSAELRELPPAAVPAFRVFHTLTRDLRFGERLPDDYDVAAYVGRGLAANAIVWSSWLMAMANVGTREAGLPSGAADVRSAIGETVPPLLGTWLLAIPRSSQNQAEAEALLRHALKEKQLCTAAWYGNPPPRQLPDTCRAPPDMGSSLALREHYPTLAVQFESLQSAIPRPRSVYWKQFEDKLGACLFELSTLDTAAPDTLCAMRREVNAFLGSLTEGSLVSPTERDRTCAVQESDEPCDKLERSALGLLDPKLSASASAGSPSQTSQSASRSVTPGTRR